MSGDDGLRAAVSAIPGFEFDTVAATIAPPLDQARVAIVTTAGLRPAGDVQLWRTSDGSFTELPDDARDFQVSHFSPNFDRVGVAADLNVVLPVDRLADLAADGTIGSVNGRHLAFMGAQLDLATLVHDTGRAAASLLLGDAVDVVLLTPV